MEDLVELIVVVLVLEVHCESQRDHVVDVEVFLLTVGLHIEEELIFRCQGLMPIDMIDELFVPELAEALVVDPIRRWLPFEVEQVWCIGLLPRGEVLGQRSVNCVQMALLVVLAFGGSCGLSTSGDPRG